MTNTADSNYIELAKRILREGVKKEDRTGTGTLSVFGHQMRFDLSEGFPLLTTKRIPFRLVAGELLWFLSGSTNISDLVKNNINIWNDDAYRWYRQKGGELSKEEYLDNIQYNPDFSEKYGDLGPIYGYNWRSWEADGEVIDQISDVIEQIKTNPDSRRLIVSAWNTGKLKYMALPPCHTLFQFYVSDGKLSCQLYQRSADFLLGCPYNIASYALLTHLIAHVTDLEVGEFIHTFGDVHIYSNHIEQVKEQISREPRELPRLVLNSNKKDIFDFKLNPNDIFIEGYDPHPTIKAKLSVGRS